MKARIKEFGTIVDIENLYDDGTALIADGGYIKVSKLEFLGCDDIDWEQRRYEIAKEATTAIMSNAEFYEQVLYVNAEKGQRQIQVSISEAAVLFADALIAELKKKQ